MAYLESIQRRTGETNTDLINEVVAAAENFVMIYTNRSSIPSHLTWVVTELSVVAINRMGTEGNISRSEGGISESFSDMPDNIRKALNSCRLARVNGHAFETEQA